MDASLVRDPAASLTPAVAIVAGERMLFASAQLSDLAGYTVNELTSPEFRFSYLFTGEAPLLLGFRTGETRRMPAKLVPLRGEPRRIAVTIQLLATRGQETFLAVFEPDGATLQEPEASERAARALVQGLRSSLAREITGMRRLQERVTTLEIAPGPVLGMHLAAIALMHEELAKLESARKDLDARVISVQQR